MQTTDPFEELAQASSAGKPLEHSQPQQQAPAPSREATIYQPTKADLELSRQELLAQLPNETNPLRQAFLEARLRSLGQHASTSPPTAKQQEPCNQRSLREIQSQLAKLERQLDTHREHTLAELDRFERQVRKRIHKIASLISNDNTNETRG